MLRAKQIRLFSRGRDATFTKRFYVCWVPTGRVTYLVGEDYATQFDAGPGAFHGVYAVTAISQVGFAGEQPTFFQLFEINVRSGHIIHNFFPGGTDGNGDQVDDIVVAANGSFAFRGTGDNCHGRIGLVIVGAAHARSTLDCDTGSEPPGQVISAPQLQGTTVSWRHLGVMRSATLPPGTSH